MAFAKKLSFVIPCYYSELTVTGVVEDIIKEFPLSEFDMEIILVNDGSTDNTFAVIKGLAQKYAQVKALNLAKNFGQDAALMAGYSHASGDYIISLDDDGQNPPAEAHKLIAKMDEGYDAVFGKYHVKKHSRFKNWGSHLNDKMATLLLGKPKDLTLCSYYIMNRFTMLEMLKYQNAFPYIWGLILRTTDHITNIFIDHRARTVGETTFTLKKLIGLWLNGFTSFSIKPLRIATTCGGIVALLGFIFTICMVIRQLIAPDPIAGWTSLMAVLLIIGGMLMVMIGLLGEYIGRIFISQNRSPQYVIREEYHQKEIE
ncbi:MAG: glycosyltransferase family 2 protein [Lachnospiraceae bacterium]|nr:glycosyltransferase family 2 protein [Lachnospiraceae bacterium]